MPARARGRTRRTELRDHMQTTQLGETMKRLLLRVVLAAPLALPARADLVVLSDHSTIRYQTAGSGPQVIVLVPGWTMPSDVFELSVGTQK